MTLFIRLGVQTQIRQSSLFVLSPFRICKKFPCKDADNGQNLAKNKTSSFLGVSQQA